MGGIWQWLTTKCCFTAATIDTENWKRQKTLGLPALPGVGHTISWCITGFVWWICGIQSFSKLLLNIQCFQAYISGKRPRNSLLPDILTIIFFPIYLIWPIWGFGVQVVSAQSTHKIRLGSRQLPRQVMILRFFIERQKNTNAIPPVIYLEFQTTASVPFFV